jgi:hypothetical protein
MHIKKKGITHIKGRNAHKKVFLNKYVKKFLFFPKTHKNTQRRTKTHKNSSYSEKKLYKIVKKIF